MNRDRDDLRQLLGEAVFLRHSAALRAGWADPHRAAEALPRDRRIEELQVHLVDVHRHELAKLMFELAVDALARGPHGAGPVCGLRRRAERQQELQEARERIARGSSALDAEPVESMEVLFGCDPAVLLDRSLALVPDAVVRAGRALVEIVSGEPGAALERLHSEGVSATPRGRSRTWEMRGMAHACLGDAPRAAEAYCAASEQDPSSESAALHALFFSSEQSESRAFDAATERVAALGRLGAEGRDALDLQRRAIESGRWTPSDHSRARFLTLENRLGEPFDALLTTAIA